MTEKYIPLIKEIVQKYLDPAKYHTFIFGSLADGTFRRSSDIDIGIEGPRLKPSVYFSLVQEFEDSNIPYVIQLVDFNTVSEEFKKIAKKHIIEL